MLNAPSSACREKVRNLGTEEIGPMHACTLGSTLKEEGKRFHSQSHVSTWDQRGETRPKGAHRCLILTPCIAGHQGLRERDIETSPKKNNLMFLILKITFQPLWALDSLQMFQEYYCEPKGEFSVSDHL